MIEKLRSYRGYNIERTWPGGYWRVQIGPSGLPIMADTLDGMREAIRHEIVRPRR